MSFSDLPAVRDIIDEDALEKAILTRPSGPPLESDRRLQNWQKWLHQRDALNKRLSKKLKRHSCELLTNYGGSLSTIKREKTVLEYARIPYPHDRYRGNPSFFEMPAALARKHPDDPDYFAVQTMPEKHLIPDVEYVGFPKCIKEEKKSICTGYRSVEDVWLGSAYRKDRVQQLQEQLKIVEPYKPELDELCMMGKKVSSQGVLNDKTKKVKDDFQIEYMPRSRETLGISPSGKHVKYSVHLNEEYVSLNNVRWCPHIKKNRELFLDFDYDVQSGKPLTKTIEIKNGTSLALRYNFTQGSKVHLFKDIVKSDEEQVFFYDKRTNIILPHETNTFDIHFKTDKSSYYTLTLQFHLIPNIFRLKFLIQLNGISTRHDLEERMALLKRYIDDKVTNNVARDVVESILKNLPTTHPFITLYTYDRGYIFDAVNQKYSATNRRPRYVYNKDVVDELETFYSTVRFKGCPPYWNYDIEDLKKITQKREKLNRQKVLLDQVYLLRLEDLKRRKLIGEDVNEEVGYYVKNGNGEKNGGQDENQKDESQKDGKPQDDKPKDDKSKDEKQDEQLENSQEGEDQQSVEKTFADRLDDLIQEVKDGIANKTEGESLTTQLETILFKLDTTCYTVNNMYDIHGYIYGVLCVTFDKIMFEVEKIKETLHIRINDHYPKGFQLQSADLYQNKVFLDEEQPKHAKIIQDFAQRGQPQSELLKNIPHEDIEGRHIAYFGAPEVDTQDKKGKKGKADKKDKKDKKDKGKKDKKEEKKVERPPTPQIDLKPVQDFQDPFKEQTPSNISVESSTQSTKSQSIVTLDSITLAENRLEEYKLNLYKIFYKNLSEAVVRISDIIETNRPRKLKLDQFKSIWKSKMSKGAVKIKYIDIKKTLCKVIAASTKRTQKPAHTQKKKLDKMELPEPLQPKESGSLWSILRAPKQPVPSVKPISYPELSLLVRRRNVTKEMVDVATIMSVCSGFDANWEDFKEAEAQAESKTYVPPTWEAKGIASGIVKDVVDDVFKESIEEVDTIPYLDDVGEEEETDVFFDDDFTEEEMDLKIRDLYKTIG